MDMNKILKCPECDEDLLKDLDTACSYLSISNAGRDSMVTCTSICECGKFECTLRLRFLEEYSTHTKIHVSSTSHDFPNCVTLIKKRTGQCEICKAEDTPIYDCGMYLICEDDICAMIATEKTQECIDDDEEEGDDPLEWIHDIDPNVDCSDYDDPFEV